MDENIGKMFRDKNKEIFLNSLTLDVERNSDALKSTTDNCVALEINKLLVFLKSYFKEQEIPYKKDELQGIKESETIIKEQTPKPGIIINSGNKIICEIN